MCKHIIDYYRLKMSAKNVLKNQISNPESRLAKTRKNHLKNGDLLEREL